MHLGYLYQLNYTAAVLLTETVVCVVRKKSPKKKLKRKKERRGGAVKATIATIEQDTYRASETSTNSCAGHHLLLQGGGVRECLQGLLSITRYSFTFVSDSHLSGTAV